MWGKVFYWISMQTETLMALQGEEGDAREGDEEWDDVMEGEEEKNLAETLSLNAIEGSEGVATTRVLGKYQIGN